MGYSVSWIALETKAHEPILPLLGLRETGVIEDVPESPIATTRAGRWLIILENQFPRRVISTDNVEELARKYPVVTCSLDEHRMISLAMCWRDGRLLWAVEHDAKGSWDHLISRGDLPQTFGVTRTKLFEQQARAGGHASPVDYIFGIPVELAASATGFRHDRGNCRFSVLASE